MNKILKDNNIKMFRLFPSSIPEKCKINRRDKVKEFIKSLRSELFSLRQNINDKKTPDLVKEFKKKYFMVNDKRNILEYDFFNDEVIHQKILNYDTTNVNLQNFDTLHEIEVMESILDCYSVKCSFTIDYSDMKFERCENNKQMNRIIKKYEALFSDIKENLCFEKGSNVIEEIKYLMKLSSRINSKNNTIIFSHVLLNNILRSFLNTFYDKDLELMKFENRFIMSNVKESIYFNEIFTDTMTLFNEIIEKLKIDLEPHSHNKLAIDFKNSLTDCFNQLERGV